MNIENRVVNMYKYTAETVSPMVLPILLKLRERYQNLYSYRQLVGRSNPEAVPAAYEHDETAGLPAYTRLTSFNLIPLHGLPLLQSNFTATCVADVPCTSSYTTSLIFTPDISFGQF